MHLNLSSCQFVFQSHIFGFKLNIYYSYFITHFSHVVPLLHYSEINVYTFRNHPCSPSCYCSSVCVSSSFTLCSSCLKVILSPCISLVSPHLSTSFPSLLSFSPSSLSLFCFWAAYHFVIDPCPGCLGIDWLSPCHWSSLSILTRFGHPLRCGQRVGGVREIHEMLHSTGR